MNAGNKCTYVISWSQTEVDSLKNAPMDALRVGASWAWHGDPVRVDGPEGFLVLDQAVGEAELRARASRVVRKLVKVATSNTTRLFESDSQDVLEDSGFVVTNGAQSFSVTIIDLGNGRAPLVMFLGNPPPKGQEYWVVEVRLPTQKSPEEFEKKHVICFTPGTLVQVPNGQSLVEDLRVGDLVQTKDNGPQAIEWIGRRDISGARLFAMPELRPIRIEASAFTHDGSGGVFSVSPHHRLLIRGRPARALFNTPEVLVMAQDLIDGDFIRRDMMAQNVRYIHLMLPRHEILFANGVEAESFHPADAGLSEMDFDARRELLELVPDAGETSHSYGPQARRSLTSPEAAILRYDAA